MDGIASEPTAMQKSRRKVRPTGALAVLFAAPKVYLIETTEGPHRIKIGTSVDPARRFADLASVSAVELRLVRVIAGDQDVERALHARFADCRIRGEWFEGYALHEVLKAMEELHG